MDDNLSIQQVLEPEIIPDTEVPTTRWGQALKWTEDRLTFFRVHVIAFTFIPLLSSGIFYASNGQHPVKYIDALFVCYSAMTVTGLSTVNLSTLTGWQQTMLYLLMLMGDVTTVSWIMVLVRKAYFRQKCEYIIHKHGKKKIIRSMISSPTRVFKNRISIPADPRASMEQQQTSQEKPRSESPKPVINDVNTFTSSPQAQSIMLPPLTPINSRGSGGGAMHAHFALASGVAGTGMNQFPQPRFHSIREGSTVPFPRRTATILTARAGGKRPAHEEKYDGFGGFPGPIQLFKKLFERAAPKKYKKLARRLTMPATQTITGDKVPWLRKNFDLIIGRNSDFDIGTLTDDEVEEIGGAEYKALRLLSYLVPMYFVFVQLISFLLFAPWLSATNRYDDVFEAQPRMVSKLWFSVFQVMAAYTGGGMSLVDLGMVPFQSAYLMVFALMLSILAGNHALPVFLRLVIWIGSKVFPGDSDIYQACSFLLEHPRRCFIYLFPAHQTWFLVICLLVFSIIEWVGFEVLNIGLEFYEAMNTGAKVVAGLFQGLAARASGFAIVPIAELAPALQFLYVVMMYIAVYPIAMSIRATNVYEERSLGIFEAPIEEEQDEDGPKDLQGLEPRQQVGKYVQWHLRRQMATDIWWLVWAVFAVAIIERNSLADPDKKWFDLFRVLFELVSAFGGIGLTAGLPDDNFAFVGAMRPLSKIVTIIIMVRGRHRELPLAVDRAVLLPHELRIRKAREEADAKAQQQQQNGLSLTRTRTQNAHGEKPTENIIGGSVV